MITDPPLLTLRRNFPRPTKEQVAAFTGVQTGHAVDAMQGSGALDGSKLGNSSAAKGFVA